MVNPRPAGNVVKINANGKGSPGAIIDGIRRLYPCFAYDFLRLFLADVVRDETLFDVSVKIAFNEAPRAFLAVSINAIFAIFGVPFVAVTLGICFPVDFPENFVR